MGRLFNNEEINNRLHHHNIGHDSVLRQQNTRNSSTPSSAEAELYAINTGATEALYLRNLLMELLRIKHINIKIHTDSSSGKSMATRIGSSRKAKHIELKHLFIQQLVLNNIVRIIKIHTNDNPADILTKYVSTETLHRHLHSVGLNVLHVP